MSIYMYLYDLYIYFFFPLHLFIYIHTHTHICTYSWYLSISIYTFSVQRVGWLKGMHLVWGEGREEGEGMVANMVALLIIVEPHWHQEDGFSAPATQTGTLVSPVPVPGVETGPCHKFEVKDEPEPVSYPPSRTCPLYLHLLFLSFPCPPFFLTQTKKNKTSETSSLLLKNLFTSACFPFATSLPCPTFL